MIRKFYLENAKGQQFHFKYATGILLSDIQGLGFSFDHSYLKYGHLHKKVSEDVPLSEITAVLNYLEGYHSYQEFIDYLNQDLDGLKLYYQSVDTKYVYVDIAGLSKGEITEGVLKSDITFNKKSYWIKERQIIIDIQENTNGKTYPYTYDYSYQMTLQGKTNILIEGSIAASTKIEMVGAVDHPEVIVSQSGKVLSTLKLNVSSKDTNIVVSSVPDNQYMHMRLANTMIDVYGDQDFEKDNFIYLNPGLVTLEFKSGVVTQTLCKVRIYEYHLG